MKQSLQCPHCFQDFESAEVDFLLDDFEHYAEVFPVLSGYNTEDPSYSRFMESRGIIEEKDQRWPWIGPTRSLSVRAVNPSDDSDDRRSEAIFEFVTDSGRGHPCAKVRREALAAVGGSMADDLLNVELDTILCPHCHMILPTALFEQDTTLHKIALFGDKRSGKTVMLMMLGAESCAAMKGDDVVPALAVQNKRDYGFRIYREHYETFQNSGILPTDSPDRWLPPLLIQLDSGKRRCILALYDNAGEMLIQISEGNSSQNRLSRLRQMDSLMLLYDAQKLYHREKGLLVDYIPEEKTAQPDISWEKAVYREEDIPSQASPAPSSPSAPPPDDEVPIYDVINLMRRDRELRDRMQTQMRAAIVIHKLDLLRNSALFQGQENTLLQDILFHEEHWDNAFFDEEAILLRKELLGDTIADFIGNDYQSIVEAFSETELFYTASLGVENKVFDAHKGKRYDRLLRPLHRREPVAWLLTGSGFTWNNQNHSK